MDKFSLDYMKNVNQWIIDINSKVNDFEPIAEAVIDLEEISDHNYELICKLKSELKKIREELNALRILQLISIQTQLKKKEA